VFRWFYDLLYERVPAEFKSAFSLEESIGRLRSATRRSSFSVLAAQAAVGRVTESKVSLQRVIPMVRNSFKPFFIGRFELRGGDTYLVGDFTAPPFTKIFMSIWFGILLLIALAMLTVFLANPGPFGFAAVGPFGMIVAGIIFLRIGKWFSRNDAAWLSRFISTALSAPASAVVSGGPAPDGAQSSPNRVPAVLQITAAFLALTALMALPLIFFGSRIFHVPSLIAARPAFPESTMRLIIGAQALLQLALALGIYRRRMIAWRLGIVFLAAGWAIPVFNLLAGGGFTAVPTVLKGIFIAGSLVVMGLWTRWWYAQRVHF